MITERLGPVFIDRDVCFASSWWLDAAKPFQDVAGHWCLRNLYLQPGQSLPLLNATELLSGLARALRGMFAGFDEGLEERLPQLTALHLFRTVPNATSTQVVGFALDRMAKLLAPRKMRSNSIKGDQLISSKHFTNDTTNYQKTVVSTS